MSVYRIRKSGREFTAARLETLRELVSRGFLRAGDEVSVDGGPFEPLSELRELAPTFKEQAVAVLSGGDGPDLFRHWQADPAVDERQASAAAGVLASFLEELGSRPSAPPPPSPAAPVPASSPDPAPPARLQPIAPDVPAILTDSSIRSVDELTPEPAAPDDGAARVRRRSPLRRARVLAEEAANVAAAPVSAGVPHSFQGWLEQGGRDKTLLHDFGMDGGGLAALGRRERRRGGVSWLRVALLALLGLSAVATHALYIRTSATSSFPLESELARRIPGAGGIPKPSSADDAGSILVLPGSEVPPDQEVVMRDRSVRERVGQGIADFGNPDELEDALYQSAINLGLGPRRIVVEPGQVGGGEDPTSRRPRQARILVYLNGIGGADGPDLDALHERLVATWMLLGKYATRSRMQLTEGCIEVAPPSAWNECYRGEDLGRLWEAQIDSNQLFQPRP